MSFKSDVHPAATAPARHTTLTVALHWVSAFAVAIAFAVAWSREALDDPQPRAALMQVHQAAGLFVLGLLILRVGTRLTQWSSRPRHELPRLLAIAALGGHLVLYGLLLAMPMLGWALANAHGHEVRLPGLPAFPTLVETDADLADTIESWHVGGSWLLLGVVGTHVAAAMFHRFVRRDDVLASMLPAPAARRVRRASRAQESRTF